jgi:hypothetical protein
MPAFDSVLAPGDRPPMPIDQERWMGSAVTFGRPNRPASRWYRQPRRTELIADRLGEMCGNQVL